MMQQVGQFGPSTAERFSSAVASKTDDGSPLGASLVDVSKRLGAIRERVQSLSSRAGAVRDRLVGANAATNGSPSQPRPAIPGAMGDLRMQVDNLSEDIDALFAALSGIL